MYLDVVELRRFYYRTRLGKIAQRALRAAIADHWPGLKGGNLAGFGFAAPFLRPLKGGVERTIALMPAQQGAFHWPIDADNITVLADERRWPLAAGFVDHLIVAHGLEGSERPAAVLAETHRVLAPGGRALIVVPNRTGLWARREGTPFGHGRPYSLGQLENFLRQHSLEPVAHSAALYGPPSQRRFWMRMANMAERAGRKLDAQRLAGALVVEVVKTAYAAPRGGAAVSVKSPLEALGGVIAPAPKPVTGRSGRIVDDG
ncbi:MAG: methyltransferase domain-containing protein [Pseudomonadota bacterium]